LLVTSTGGGCAMDLAELGRQVAQSRRQRRLSQSELAAAVGLSRQTISSLERGDITDLGIRKVLRLLEALDLTLVVRPLNHLVTLDDLRPGP
jgi:transcriptional regulator with XRE-family HTH domain